MQEIVSRSPIGIVIPSEAGEFVILPQSSVARRFLVPAEAVGREDNAWFARSLNAVDRQAEGRQLQIYGLAL